MKIALDLNIVINLDNELEIASMDELLSQLDGNQNRVIGLRITPTFDEASLFSETNTTAAFFVNIGCFVYAQIGNLNAKANTST